ncbi:MAG: DUF4286 family protein [Bdellovibrionales bacterium]
MTKVIYEVQIQLPESLWPQYQPWLLKHMAEIVDETGFTSAEFFKAQNHPSGQLLLTVHYHAPKEGIVAEYLSVYAPRFRRDGVNHFGDQVHLSRQVWILQSRVPDLTASPNPTQISPNNRKDVPMNTQANWQRIRDEIQRLTSVDELKTEVHRIGTEIRKFDFHTMLSPAAQAKVKVFERRYANLMRSVQQAQRQVDREFNRLMRQIKTRKTDVSKAMKQQKSKLQDIQRTFTASKAKVKKTAKKGKTAATKTRTTTKKKRK